MVTKEDWTVVCQDMKNQCTFVPSLNMIEGF